MICNIKEMLRILFCPNLKYANVSSTYYIHISETKFTFLIKNTTRIANI